MQAKDGTQLDPGVAALVQSIKKKESGGNYNAVGDNGTSHGAYQYQKGTWEGRAKEVGLDPKDFSPTNQDKVTYYWAKKRKEQGWTPEMIAAGHNTSEENAKSGAWKTMKGDHKYDDGTVIGYDVPKYVSDVMADYKKQKDAYEAKNPASASDAPRIVSYPGEAGNSTDYTNTKDTLGFKAANAVAGFVDTMVNPFVQLGAATHNVFTSPENDIKSVYGQQVDSAPVNVPGYINGKEASAGQTAKQVAGAGLGVATTVVPFLRGGKAVLASSPILGGLGLGYATDVGQNLNEDKNIALPFTENSAFTPGFGTAVGGGLGLATKGLMALATPTAKLQEDAFLNGIEGMKNRAKTTDNAFVKNTIQRTVDGKPVEITPVETWLKEKAPIPEVMTSGGTATANAKPAVEFFNNKISEVDDALLAQLDKEGVKFSVAQVKQIASDIVNNTDNVAGIANGKTTREEVLAAINKRIDNLVAEHGDVWNGKAVRNVLKGANADFKDEATKDVSRLLGDSMREIMYNQTSTGKASLNKMQELITARKFAEALDGKKVAGGGLGRMFARGIGTSIGAISGGPLSAILGGEVGARIGQGIQKMTFLSPTGEVKAGITSLLAKIGMKAKDIQKVTEVAKTLPVTATVEDIAKQPEAPQSLRDILLKASRAMQEEDTNLEKYVPDSELPTIDMGPKGKSKYNKSIPGMPNIKY